MTQIAKAYVQLVPSAEGIGSKVSSALSGELASAGNDSGGSFASRFLSVAKKAIAAAGIGKMISSALNAGADYEQNIGGIETLFGEGADIMVKHANEAFRTAGLSANEYMETVTAFAASLKQSVGGDMETLTSVANMAVVDMSDNANKMGTSMQSIQNAYQGFAKQNYTMLDNLKLGYGGTKSEMERLLEDASKISGIKYNLDNLDDVFNAIHVIQTELGITGTTAVEAEHTFSGSMASMKSAATNVLTAIASGENLQGALSALGETVKTFLFNNFIPMVAQVLRSIPTVIGDLGGIIIQSFNMAANHADEIVAFGAEFVADLIIGISESLPAIIGSFGEMAAAIGKALLEYDWVGLIKKVVGEIADNLAIFADEFLGGEDCSVITSLIDGILDGLPRIIDEGMEIVMALIDGIIQNLPAIASNVGLLIGKIIATIIEHLPEIIEQGITIVAYLNAGLIKALPSIVSAVGELIRGIWDAFTKVDWSEIGKNIIRGLINGMGQLLGRLTEAAKSVAQTAWNTAKGWLGIRSPSKKFEELGRYSMLGYVEGIESSQKLVQDAMSDMSTYGINAEIAGSAGNNYRYGNASEINGDQLVAAITNGIKSAMSSVGGKSNSPVILNINGREFCRAVYSDLQAVGNERGRRLVNA